MIFRYRIGRWELQHDLDRPSQDKHKACNYLSARPQKLPVDVVEHLSFPRPRPGNQQDAVHCGQVMRDDVTRH
jgi:hypothetical protein